MKALPALIAACLLALSPVTASAQSGPLTLEYSAPRGCLSEEEFRDEVSARLGTIPFGDGGSPLVVTIVAHNKAGWLGTLELQGRERVLKNADCPALARDLAAALAVQLDAPPPPSDEPKPGGVGVVGGVIGGVISDDKQTVTLDVQAEDPSLTLYVIRGQQLAYGSVGGYASTAVGYSFESLCTAPCKLELEPNDYHFAIGRGVATPLPLDNRVRIQAPSRVDLAYRSRRAVRIVGFLVSLVGSSVGLGLFVKGAADQSKSMMITGGVVAGASFVVGLPMTWVGDRNSLELTPAR
jgi:hypothetical protein